MRDVNITTGNVTINIRNAVKKMGECANQLSITVTKY